MGMFDDVDEEQKTEEATPRRRQEARDKGQVALSTELLAAIVLFGWLSVIVTQGGTLVATIGAALRGFLQLLTVYGREDLTIESSVSLLRGTLQQIALPALALIAPLFVLTLFVSYAQIGLGIAGKAMELDPQKLDPMRGMQRLFSMRSINRTFLSFLKLVLIGAGAAFMAWQQIDKVIAVGALEVGPALAAIGYIVLRCALVALTVILVIGLIDFFFQRRQHDKEMRMTKQEVREEVRMSDGDPQVKARIRRAQREMAAQRMMSAVPKATVVITNPTHFAVALMYDRDAPAEKRGAPRVVAKGVDHVAQKIKEVAREAGVIVYENAPLARTLHARCEIGDDVPMELYQAVAEVLAYVYGLQEERVVRTA